MRWRTSAARVREPFRQRIEGFLACVQYANADAVVFGLADNFVEHTIRSKAADVSQIDLLQRNAFWLCSYNIHGEPVAEGTSLTNIIRGRAQSVQRKSKAHALMFL